MKHPVLFASALANIALVAVFAFQPNLAPPAMREALQRYLPVASASAPAPQPAKAATPATESPRERSQLWSKLASDDLRTLIARLRDAGFPPDVIRYVVQSQLAARYDPQMRALQINDPSLPFWEIRNNAADPKRQEALLAISQERSRILRDLFKDPFFANTTTTNRPAWAANLPDQKVDLIQQIESDYSEMISGIRVAGGGLLLPEDREKIAFLEREKRADLASVLSPEQYADYELRTSALTRTLGSRFGGFEPTDAEFRSIYQTYQAISEKFPGGISSGMLNTMNRDELAAQAGQQLQAALGERRYNDYLRETNSEFQQLNRLVQQEKLPSSTALQVFEQRDHVERESNRIFDDPALSPDQKRAALQQLSQNTRGQIMAALGPVAGKAYENNINHWLTQLEQGGAPTFGKIPTVVISSGGSTSSFGGGSPVTYRRLPREQRP